MNSKIAIVAVGFAAGFILAIFFWPSGDPQVAANAPTFMPVSTKINTR